MWEVKGSPSSPQQRERQDGGCTPQVPLLIGNQAAAPRDLFVCSKFCVFMVLFNYSHPSASTSQKKEKRTSNDVGAGGWQRREEEMGNIALLPSSRSRDLI